MCGFVYLSRKDGRPAYKSVLKRYRAQKARGTQGFGYVAIHEGQVVSYQRAETEHEIVNLLAKEKASEILFHHRNPTGTPNMSELAHPFLIESDLLEHQYFVGHNGTIRNSSQLKDAHEKMGFEYSSETLKAFISKNGEHHIHGVAWNDSESIAIETALALDGKKFVVDTEGPAAVVGLQTKGKKVISRFFFRNNLNPLKFHEDKIMISITSMGEGVIIPPEKMFKLDATGGYSVISEKFLPFLSYKPTINYDYSGKTTDRWEDGKWVSNDTETTMGFLRHKTTPMMRAVGDILGLPPSPEDIQGEDIEYGSPDDSLDWETDALLSEMTTAELWAEHDLSVSREKDLKKELEKIDALDRYRYTPAILEKREELQNKFDEADKWTQQVMDEIVSHNSKEDDDIDTLNFNERMSK